MIDLIEEQKKLEELYAKNLESSRIIEEFKEITEDPFELQVLKIAYLHKRIPVGVMVGSLCARYELEEIQEKLTDCVEKDLIDFDPALGIFIMHWDLSQDVKDSMALFQYPLPMVCPPKKVKDNKHCGYYTFAKSAMLHGFEEEKDICLDHLNRVNSIPLKINFEVVSQIKCQWHNLDAPKIGESYQEYLKRIKNYKKFCKDSMQVLEMLKDKTVYVTHNYDTRGRIYAGGYHFNPQGTDWCKASVLFAEGETVI